MCCGFAGGIKMTEKLVHADNWEEMWNIILEQLPQNCINCKHGEQGKTTNANRFIFCTKHITMVDLTLGQSCNQWE